MAHLSVEAEFDSEYFQVLTSHCCGKLGLFTKEEFLSETNIGFISFSKSKFRDQDQTFWLGKTLGKSNPNFTLDQKINTTKDQLQIEFWNLKLVRSKSLVFPFEALFKI